MAIYHLHDQAVSRTSGRSPVAMAAYRAGEMLVEESEGVARVHDYRRKSLVVHREVMVPEGAPEWMRSREKLWNGIVYAEKRKDAVYLHEMDVAIPKELSQAEGVALVRDFARSVCVERGMVVDIAVHWEEGNPHAHLMQATRVVEGEGFGKKNRDWHRKTGLRLKRKVWEDRANSYLERAGALVRIDARSYADQGVELLPSCHEGVPAREVEARGGVSWVREENRNIAWQNQQRVEADPGIILRKLAVGGGSFREADLAAEVFRRVRGEAAAYHALMGQIVRHPALEVMQQADGKEGAIYRYRDLLVRPSLEPEAPKEALRSFEEAVQAAAPLLRRYQDVYRKVEEGLQRQKLRVWNAEEAARLAGERKQGMEELAGERGWLQGQSTHWFLQGKEVAKRLESQEMGTLVALYDALPDVRLKRRHRILRMLGAKRRQEKALRVFTVRLIGYLKRMEHQAHLEREWTAATHRSEGETQKERRRHKVLFRRLQQLEAAIEERFLVYGPGACREVRQRARDHVPQRAEPAIIRERPG